MKSNTKREPPVHAAEVRSRMRRRPGNAINHERNTLKQVFDASPVGLMLVDENTVITAINDVAAKLADKDAAEMVNRQPGDAFGCLHASEQPGGCGKGSSCASCPIRAVIEGVLKSGRPVHGVEVQPILIGGGAEVRPWIEISAQPATINGRPHLIASVVNITRRKQAEEALRASQEIIEGIINAIPVRVFWKDKNLVYLGCNAVFARDAGFADPKDIVGKDDYQMGWRKQAELYRTDDRQVIKSGCAKSLIEEPQTTPEGNTVTLLTSKVPLRSSAGEIIGVLGTYMDITDHKRADEALKAKSADLERANEEVKQFAYIVSHDFRAPLVNLKGFAGEIRLSLAAIQSALAPALPLLSEEQSQTAAKALQKDIPEALHFIDAAAGSMDGLVSALLKLSRLGRQELHREPIHTADIVERALKNLAHQIGERGATACIADLPDVVADRTAMEQIMGNILTNAVLYLERGRPGRIEVGGCKGPGETTFFVRDNGRGIAREDMPKVFAPFRRAGKQDVKGEGMGLAYVQTLVRRHGGEIRCESEPGVGTTFTFTVLNVPEQGGREGHAARF